MKKLVFCPSHIICPFKAKISTLAVSGFTVLIGGEEGNLGAIAPHEPRPLRQQPHCEIRHHLYQFSTSSLLLSQHTGGQASVVGAHLARGGHGGVRRDYSDVSFVAALVVRGEEEAHSGAGQRK